MARKAITPEVEVVENIHSETLEEIMGTRFATYAKYVIQDRAIPDARDGLKPVQRRIIYAMYKDGNIFSRPTRKCAHTVGAHQHSVAVVGLVAQLFQFGRQQFVSTSASDGWQHLGRYPVLKLASLV